MKFEEAIKIYQPTIGIEVHVELSTKTKLFCSAINPAYDNNACDPNTMTTPVSMGLPGALPVINEKAIEYACKIGLALNATISQTCSFARKNYFYPDLTKNFQTSQSDEPIISNGSLNVSLEGNDYLIGIERAHLEEDAGKNTHVGGSTGRIHGSNYSMIDYNRAGVPLVEIVSKPFSYDGKIMPELAAAYVRELRDIFRELNVSCAQMERGNVRADINVSLSPTGSNKLGTRTETKNVNSFKSIESAVRFEIERQADVLNRGEEVLQETRHWHEQTLSTSSGRVKSDSDDYRYFPEPNLVKVNIDNEYVEKIKAHMPEMPAVRKKRLFDLWGLPVKEFEDIINADALNLIEETVSYSVSPNNARKWWMGELLRMAKDCGISISQLKITPKQVSQIQELVDKKVITDKIARNVISLVLDGKGDPRDIVEQENLSVVSDDSQLEEKIDKVFSEQADVVEKLKQGNMAPIGVIIGGVMKETQGKADANIVRNLIMKKIKEN